jgi:excisionase family DNA binding protein
MQKKTDRAPISKLAYRVDEAGEVSGLGRFSIYELIGDGRLSSMKVGGRRLIVHEDLEAAEKQQGGVSCAARARVLTKCDCDRGERASFGVEIAVAGKRAPEKRYGP